MAFFFFTRRVFLALPLFHVYVCPLFNVDYDVGFSSGLQYSPVKAAKHAHHGACGGVGGRTAFNVLLGRYSSVRGVVMEQRCEKKCF